LVSDHRRRLETVDDDRSARGCGPERSVVGEVADTFLACGVLEHRFARIRCDECAREYVFGILVQRPRLLPSCHAKLTGERRDLAGGIVARMLTWPHRGCRDR